MHDRPRNCISGAGQQPGQRTVIGQVSYHCDGRAARPADLRRELFEQLAAPGRERAATEAAADIRADRRTFVLDEQAWQLFDQALSRPAADVPGLRELLSTPTVLDQGAAEPPPA